MIHSLNTPTNNEELKKVNVREIDTNVLVGMISCWEIRSSRSAGPENATARLAAVHQFLVDGILDRLVGHAPLLEIEVGEPSIEGRGRV